MSRVRRASVAASFTYVQFALSMVVGIAMVPFVLSQVDIRTYGLWLASGEVLAYAAMADLGVLGIVPWTIAEADGRRDRSAVRMFVSNGFCAAALLALLYAVVVALLWTAAPGILQLTAEQRALIAGPLAIIACVTGIVLPLRVANATLVGLQDVRFLGSLATFAWLVDVLVTATLLLQGYGLYALALGASIPALLVAAASIVRLRMVAPDVLRAWPAPRVDVLSRLFRDGFGVWLAGWGWRLSATTDSILVTYLFQTTAVTRFAMTSKLGHVLMQLAWVPGDSGLVGLAQLSGEGQRERVRDAVTALFRLHLTLGAAAACVVLAANGAFVRWWLPDGIFAGRLLTVFLAAALLAITSAHAFSTIASVLGRRVRVGVAGFLAGIAQLAFSYVLARRFGLVGLPAGAILAQVLVLYPLLARPLAEVSGVTPSVLLTEVFGRWAARSLPVLAAATAAGLAFWTMPIWSAGAVAGLLVAGCLWLNRGLILGYEPVAALLRGPLSRVRLEWLLPLAAEPR